MEPPRSIDCLTPFVHVADVERSVAFYAQLGFVEDDLVRDEGGRATWAFLATPKGGKAATLMLCLASAPIVPEEQAILLYMYSGDVAGLRSHLLERGLHDAGRYCGQPGPNQGREVVFEPYYPHHMPAGELRVADPDGHCILVGQLG